MDVISRFFRDVQNKTSETFKPCCGSPTSLFFASVHKRKNNASCDQTRILKDVNTLPTCTQVVPITWQHLDRARRLCVGVGDKQKPPSRMYNAKSRRSNTTPRCKQSTASRAMDKINLRLSRKSCCCGEKNCYRDFHPETDKCLNQELIKFVSSLHDLPKHAQDAFVWS